MQGYKEGLLAVLMFPNKHEKEKSNRKAHERA